MSVREDGEPRMLLCDGPMSSRQLRLLTGGPKAGGRIDARELGFGASIAAIAVSIGLTLRYALGGAVAVGTDTQTIVSLWETVMSLAEAVTQPSLTRWPVLAVVMFGPVVLWLLLNRTRIDQRQAGLIMAAAIISLVTLFTGSASEFRRHLPAFAVLQYAAVAAECGWRSTATRTGSV